MNNYNKGQRKGETKKQNRKTHKPTGYYAQKTGETL